MSRGHGCGSGCAPTAGERAHHELLTTAGPHGRRRDRADRIVAGVGVPQISAISDAAAVAVDAGVPVIADGGIRYSGDIAKAVVAGASAIMIGSLFAGTDESPGEVDLVQGRTYKSYRGMGSLGAMAQRHGSSDRYFQEVEGDGRKLVPEGVEGRVEYKGKVSEIIYQLQGGLRSSMGYIGAKNLKEINKKAKFVKITKAGFYESMVHSVEMTQKTINYKL